MTRDSQPQIDNAARSRVALLVEYDGTALAGSQYQSHHGQVPPTVQHVLEEALRTLQLDTSRVTMASRTDAGVHALGQVAHVDLHGGLHGPATPERSALLPRALNALLPASVSVRAAAVGVSPTFHSQRSAVAKWYRYRIFNRPERCALLPAHAWHVRAPLDEHAMAEAAALLPGTREFTGFKCMNTDVTNDRCTVYHASVRREGDWIELDLAADRFLYKMVRCLAGFLVSIGDSRRQLHPAHLDEALARLDRRFTATFAPTAPPSGLALMAVGYPPDIAPFASDPYVRYLETLVKPDLQLPEKAPPEPIAESRRNEDLFSKAS